LNQINSMLPVQPHPKKYSAFAVGQIIAIVSPIHPGKRGVSRSSRTRGWMRWTQRRRARWWSQGGVSRERSSVAQTTGASRAFARISVGTSPIGVLTRGCCVRRSRVVLASVADVKPAETRRPDRASGKSQSAGDGGKRNSSPGRARSKP